MVQNIIITEQAVISDKHGYSSELKINKSADNFATKGKMFIKTNNK